MGVIMLSMQEFEKQTPYFNVVRFLHNGEWLVVDSYHSELDWVLIQSNGQEYRIEDEIVISYFDDK